MGRRPCAFSCHVCSACESQACQIRTRQCVAFVSQRDDGFSRLWRGGRRRRTIGHAFRVSFRRPLPSVDLGWAETSLGICRGFRRSFPACLTTSQTSCGGLSPGARQSVRFGTLRIAGARLGYAAQPSLATWLKGCGRRLSPFVLARLRSYRMASGLAVKSAQGATRVGGTDGGAGL